jgi:phosphoserine phosphatase
VGDSPMSCAWVCLIAGCLQGIDELAQASPAAAQQVALLTAQAMGGALPFADALAQRLQLIRPDRQAVETCAARVAALLQPGARLVRRRMPCILPCSSD